MELRCEAYGRCRLEVVEVDVDRCPRVASRYAVRSVPALEVVRGGAVVGERVGAIPMVARDEFVARHA